MRLVYTFIMMFVLCEIFFSQNVSMPVGTATLSVSRCGDLFTDQNPGGNYSSNQNSTLYICPSTPGTYVSVTFTSFNLEAGFDFLRIYNGGNGTSGIIAQLTGATIPGTYTSSSADGCLAFRFRSDGSGNLAGWSATISCSATPGPFSTATSNQDCGFSGGTTICNDASFSGNSSGGGNNDFSLAGNDGCLAGENQSSWYYFSPVTSGTLSFNIIPANGTDDYDFAIWGPSTSLQCPAFSLLNPVRCSYAGVAGNTGLGNGATDNSEGAGGDGYVAPLNVTAGQFYVMLIDNFSATASPFTLDWTFGGGASLNCAALPVILKSFAGSETDDGTFLYWTTASEKNSKHFLIERSEDGLIWKQIGSVDASINSNIEKNYNFKDMAPLRGVNYYRLHEVDWNGLDQYSDIIAITNSKFLQSIDVIPNPSSGQKVYLKINGYASQTLLLTIKNIVGQNIFQNQYEVQRNDDKLFLPENLEKGTYIVDIQSLGEKKSKKIVIN
jgi:hypothetical protein